MKKNIALLLFFSLFLCPSSDLTGWGFYAHKKVNRQAVFSLPKEMIGFYKAHLDQITEKAVDADKRRHNDKDEAPRHYIDVDVYGDSGVFKMPRYWKDAVEKYSEDTLIAYGIVPWHVNVVRYRLIQAFKEKDVIRSFPILQTWVIILQILTFHCIPR